MKIRTNLILIYQVIDVIWSLIQSRGVHSIVKLNTTCDKNKPSFYIKDHQNRSNVFSILFSLVDIHNIYYTVKICNQI